jgi:hypothetical protein
MLSGRSLRFTVPLIAVGALLSGAAGSTPAQDAQAQPQSVADAARQAREAKKAAPKSKTITDDDLNKIPKTGAEAINAASPSTSAAQPASPAAAEAAAETPDQTPAPASSEASPAKKAGANPELAKLKAQIAQVKKELDLAQRELALDQDTFFSNPDHDHDTAGKAKLAAEQQQINDKQQQLDTLNTRLAALLELEARKKKSADETAPPATAQPQF